MMKHNGKTIRILGDPHLGRQFVRGVPLHRRGEREKMQWAEFGRQLMAGPCDYHVCMGDLFDAAVVPYWVVLAAAKLYREAARMYPDTTFVILRGNHDASRDLEAVSAFDVFSEIVADLENLFTVDGAYTTSGMAFFGWHPTRLASEIVAGFTGDIAFGHWDTQSFGGEDLNMIPTEQLLADGFKKAFTGHVHKPSEGPLDGLDVTVVGSMQPFAHGEEVDDSLYVTIGLADVEGDYKNKCVRVVLQPGEVFDRELDCLQLTIKKLTDEQDDGPTVELGNFDLMALFEDAFNEADLAPEFRQKIIGRYHAERLSP